MWNAIDARTVSAFPLSVGTSLALESVFNGVQEPIDPSRVIPQKVEINNYDAFWINVGTLFRNLYNALNKDSIKFLLPSDFADGLEQEMETINDLCLENSGRRIGAFFYHCSYADIHKRFKRGNLRTPKSDLQLQYAKLYQKTFDLLLKRSRQQRIREIVEYESKFSGGNKNVLILTHFPLDLLNYRKFKGLELLESHTGILKKQPEWCTKYYNGRDLNFLPLNGILLTVFGDDHHFHPQPKKMKDAILEIAKKRRWHCLTDSKEIVNGIKTLNDFALRDALLENEQS